MANELPQKPFPDYLVVVNRYLYYIYLLLLFNYKYYLGVLRYR